MGRSVEQIIADNDAKMRGFIGVFWVDIDAKGNPIPFPIRLKRADFHAKATMANVAVEIGAFPSLTEAKKNGKNQPITLGEHKFKGKFGGITRVIIE